MAPMGCLVYLRVVSFPTKDRLLGMGRACPSVCHLAGHEGGVGGHLAVDAPGGGAPGGQVAGVLRAPPEVPARRDGPRGAVARDAVVLEVVPGDDRLHALHRHRARLKLLEELRAGALAVRVGAPVLGLHLIVPGQRAHLLEVRAVVRPPVELRGERLSHVRRVHVSWNLLENRKQPCLWRRPGSEAVEVQHHPLVVVGAAVVPPEHFCPLAPVRREPIGHHRAHVARN
mmetsp:Transcript_19867/g.43465  ORF Transcript_19867/g.43465 Transcript_19867/m.43465 type:complete len:229 (-) Transcript_19867:1224-1910(-)